MFASNGSNYLLNSVYSIILILILVFSSFEKGVSSRTLVFIASMIAIGSLGRVAFCWLPQFKPVTAVVIIASCFLNPIQSFVVGSGCGLVSSLFFGLGPWSLYQMVAWGLIGCLGSFLFSKRKDVKLFIVIIYGFISTFFIYGIILDTSSVLMMLTDFNIKSIITIYSLGIPFNLVHAISTVVFLFFLYKPITKKIIRLQSKYEF